MFTLLVLRYCYITLAMQYIDLLLRFVKVMFTVSHITNLILSFAEVYVHIKFRGICLVQFYKMVSIL